MYKKTAFILSVVSFFVFSSPAEYMNSKSLQTIVQDDQKNNNNNKENNPKALYVDTVYVEIKRFVSDDHYTVDVLRVVILQITAMVAVGYTMTSIAIGVLSTLNEANAESLVRDVRY